MTMLNGGGRRTCRPLWTCREMWYEEVEEEERVAGR